MNITIKSDGTHAYLGFDEIFTIFNFSLTGLITQHEHLVVNGNGVRELTWWLKRVTFSDATDEFLESLPVGSFRSDWYVMDDTITQEFIIAAKVVFDNPEHAMLFKLAWCQGLTGQAFRI